jgi:hypothetical protein
MLLGLFEWWKVVRFSYEEVTASVRKFCELFEPRTIKRLKVTMCDWHLFLTLTYRKRDVYNLDQWRTSGGQFTCTTNGDILINNRYRWWWDRNVVASPSINWSDPSHFRFFIFVFYSCSRSCSINLCTYFSSTSSIKKLFILIARLKSEYHNQICWTWCTSAESGQKNSLFELET